MDPTQPNPDRFESYKLLPGGKRFTIPGSNLVFKLDQFGGWKDQYGNYYNCDGKTEVQPEDSQLTPSEGSVDQADVYEDFDQYAPENDDSDDEKVGHMDAETVRNLERVSHNMEMLSEYPASKPLRVGFRNMPFKVPPKSVYEAYAAKVDGIINIDFKLDEKHRRNGQGFFIMQDVKSAEKLIKLEGEIVVERKVQFSVENLQEFSLYPLTQEQMKPFWGSAKPNKEKPKVEQSPKEKKPETVKKEAKIQEKIQPKPAEFQVCRLNFEVFTKKNHFFDWIKKIGGDGEKDIKNINKVEKPEGTVVTMEVRTKLLEKCNGQKHEGKEVKFTPL